MTMPARNDSTGRMETMMIRRLQKILLFTALLGLTACSLPKFAYEQAPGYVASQLDDAFDLDSAQSAALDERLQQFFAWHRKQELSQYRVLLERAARDSSDGIRADEFMRLLGEVRAAWRRAVAKAIDSVGDLATTLTPEQIASYEAYYKERSAKYRDYLQMTAQQRENYRLTRNLDRLEQWFGEFNEFDKARVSERLRQLPDNYEDWIRYRDARQQALVAALRDAPNNGLDKARLKDILLGEDTDYARAYEPIRQAYWQAYAQAIQDISTWVGTGQRQRLVSRLEDYARIAKDLEQG